MVMNNNGSNKINLTKNLNGNNYAPVWSPDGSKILFYSDFTGSFELYLMNSDGAEIDFLLDKKEMDVIGFTKSKFIDAWDNGWGATEQYKASFSPDGKQIAFSRNLDGNREIFVVDITGKNIKRLTNNKIHDGFPIWSPVK